MDQIKEAFDKVKEDMQVIGGEVLDIKEELAEIQQSILELLKKISPTDRQTDTSTHKQENQTLRHINKTQTDTSTHTSTDKPPFKPLKPQYSPVSIGNGGVSTDRQTDTSTDTSTHNLPENAQRTAKTTENAPNPTLVLEQLDTIKKEIRLKIKRLTKQEMLVLSSIYQFEDQGQLVDYAILSQKLNLSQSSIRDYTQRIINKGIPLIKEKINNKKVILHVSDDLRALASLNTLISLRNL